MRRVSEVAAVLVILSVAVWFRIHKAPVKQITEQNDPAMTVMRAEMSWGAVDKPNRCQSESSGQAGVGLSESTLTEAASRDHYRQVVEQRTDDGSRSKREFIVTGRDIYSREDNGPWQHTIADDNHIPSRQTRPQLATIAGWKYRFNDINGRTLLKLVGREQLDRSTTLLYEMTVEDPAKNRTWTVRYWIGTDDVLLHQSEEVQYSNGLEVARKTTTCRYEPVTIEKPM